LGHRNCQLAGSTVAGFLYGSGGIEEERGEEKALVVPSEEATLLGQHRIVRLGHEVVSQREEDEMGSVEQGRTVPPVPPW
jgi:hypothetical protein